MPRKFAARRYAQALFELGLTAGRLDKWSADMQEMAAVARDPQIAAFLTYPRVNLRDKAEVLSRSIKDLSPQVLNLTSLLIKEGFSDRLGEVASAFQKLVDAHDGIDRGRLTTAISLSDKEVEDLGRQIGSILNRKVVFSGEINPGLLGGFQARVAGKLLDGSTLTALATLKKELSH